jgi:hypothetical protein
VVLRGDFRPKTTPYGGRMKREKNLEILFNLYDLL